ncbi:MAG: VOC family protein [Betaproteobacteria bacterium]|nr:VOC family protein [Betaproteobacteria bacterium]
MKIQPYLFFDGRCDEAIAFYREALGAKVVMVMRFSESPDPPPPGMLPPGAENKIMHAELDVEGTPLMMSDGDCQGGTRFKGVSLSIALPDASRAQTLFDALAKGGQIIMPLGKTFWSPCFGMLTDRFGLGWMINVAA